MIKKFSLVYLILVFNVLFGHISASVPFVINSDFGYGSIGGVALKIYKPSNEKFPKYFEVKRSTDNGVEIKKNAPMPLSLNVEVWQDGVYKADYLTLKGAFDVINAGTYNGILDVKINASTTETASAVLNASGSGSASYSSIHIYPTISGLSVSGNIEGALIYLNGADNVIIDGRVNATGSTKDLTIENKSILDTYNKYISTIRFINDASTNTVK